jgi:outer membrane cobalamin receptor
VNYGKWNVITGLQCLAGLYTEVGQKEQKECAYLLNATVNYQLCKLLRLWVRGENLLAQSYEFVQGYPMPRATFMGGVNIAF